MGSMEVTHTPFSREARIDSGFSILSFHMARNLFKELRLITGLQWLPGLGPGRL